jgi:predicted permease
MLAILLPTFLLVGVGLTLGRLARVPSRPLAQVAFWVLSPGLIFESLRTAELSAVGVVVLFALLHQIGMFALSLGAGRILFPHDRDARAATSLVLTFGNTGNLGLPLLLFAYGPVGVDVGAVFLATTTMLLATLGVTVAAADGGKVRWRDAFARLLRVPWPYAVAGALLFRWVGFPAVLAGATGLLADGAIPLLLLLLGLELAQVRLREVGPNALAVSLLRLFAGAGLAWGLAGALRTEGVVRGSLIIGGSVPSAVNGFLLAAQFGRRPGLAASVIFLSTALSLGTLLVTLFLLGIAG